MTSNNLQETLQTLAAVLDDVVAEAVRKDLAGQRGDGDARALALEDVAEVLEVGVAATHDRVLQLEGGDVGAADDLVRGVHVPGCAVGLGVADLELNIRIGDFKERVDFFGEEKKERNSFAMVKSRFWA